TYRTNDHSAPHGEYLDYYWSRGGTNFFRRGGRMKTWTAIVALLVLPARAQATEWQAFAGIQSTDKGRQILAFLPNELWVQVGDSITWQFLTDEIHTVSFLT